MYVNGQDINRLVIADLGDRASVVVKEVGPEAYLATIDTYLKERNVHPADVTQLYVVVGPGSPTALRASLSILNTMKFVYQIETISLKKDPKEPDEQTLLKIRSNDAQVIEQPGYMEPIYTSGPKITVSNKDALGRET